MKSWELECTGSLLMSRFQGLSAGNTEQVAESGGLWVLGLFCGGWLEVVGPGVFDDEHPIVLKIRIRRKDKVDVRMVPPKLNYPLPPYPNIVAHSSLLLSSFRAWMGRDLIETPPSDPAQAAIALFKAPCVVLSHGVQDEPILNYGNLAALRLWEMSWDEFTSFPSRATAEPMDQAERARFLKEVTESGYVENYSGIRISKSGRCFRIENAVVWNLIDQSGIYRGQAASFMPT